MARDPTRWTILYDQDCRFCRWSLAQVLGLDRRRRLRPVALGTREADELLADLDPEDRAASWHLISPDGRRTSGGTAAPQLFRLLPGGSVPAALLAAAPTFTERAYRWVADHRSRFSRLIPERSKARADMRIARHADRQEASRAGSCSSM